MDEKGGKILVPVYIRDAEDFEFDLSIKIQKCNPPSSMDNTEELSLLAIDKTKKMFKNSDFCNCNFKNF